MLECNVNNTSDTVASCIVLHNICEMYGDGYLEEWTHHDDSSSSSVPSSHTSTTGGTSDVSVVRDAAADLGGIPGCHGSPFLPRSLCTMRSFRLDGTPYLTNILTIAHLQVFLSEFW